jgi:CheY-like chemotaxis protein
VRILVLDDDRTLATILADHLAERGHRVVPAYDGQLALVFCEQSAFDVIVVDLVLPGMSGIDVVEKLRQKNLTARAIIMTGFADLLNGESARLAALGVEAVIEKPFSFADLDEAVERPASQVPV